MLTVLLVLCSTLAPASSITYEKRFGAGHYADVITIDVSDPQVKVGVVLALGFPGSDESVRSMLARTNPAAAVTGTFFSKVSRLPVGDIVVDGQLRYFGGLGTALAITPDNAVIIRRVRHGRHENWTPYETVLAAGPTLVTDGRVEVNPALEGFSDPHVLGRAPRAAVGKTLDGKLLFVVVQRPVYLGELARMMKAFGCTDAMNLDGGASTMLAYRGKLLVPPSRYLVNILIAYESVPQQFRFAPGLPPDEAAVREAAREQRASEYYRAGLAELRAGNHRGAAEKLQAATVLHPTSAAYQVALADALRDAGMRRPAGAAYATAASIYADKRHWPEARFYAQRAALLDPEQLLAYKTLVRVYVQKGDQAEADRWERKVHALELQLTSFALAPDALSVMLGGLRTAKPGRPALKPRSRALSGTVRGRKYKDRPLGFSIEVPAEWQMSLASGNTELAMAHAQRPYRASLVVTPALQEVRVSEAADAYFAGTYGVPESRMYKRMSGGYGLQLERQERVAGAVIRVTCVFLRRGDSMYVLAFVAPQREIGRGRRDFDAIMRSLEVWAQAGHRR